MLTVFLLKRILLFIEPFFFIEIDLISNAVHIEFLFIISRLLFSFLYVPILLINLGCSATIYEQADALKLYLYTVKVSCITLKDKNASHLNLYLSISLPFSIFAFLSIEALLFTVLRC